MNSSAVTPIRTPRPDGTRLAPHDLGAEADLLGAIMLSPRALDAAVGIITPEDFYKPAYGAIYTAVLELAAAGEPVDARTVADNLARAGQIDQAGGIAGVTQLIADTPATSSAGRYARIVRDLADRRRLIAKAREIAELGYDTAEPFRAVLDQAEQMLYEIGDSARDDSNAARLSEAADQWLQLIEQRHHNGPQGTPTGIVDLDARLGGGLRPGHLYTVAARPAMGKSLLGAQVAYHAAETHDIPSLIVSAEMPTEELVDRLVASQARVDNQRIRTGTLTEGDWPKISGALTAFHQVPLWIYDASDITLAAIRAQIRRAATAARRPIGMVVVDYLQLLSTAQKRENRQLEVDTLARGLKVMARGLNVPVVSLCQVNRNVESRADKRPMLADLRESGGIEAHSDAVIAIYRDEVYNPDTADRGTAELIILKQRGGPIGTVQVAYLDHYGTFANMARV